LNVGNGQRARRRRGLKISGTPDLRTWDILIGLEKKVFVVADEKKYTLV
jgi:hypothetical protein